MISRESSDRSDVFRSFGLVLFFSLLGLVTYSVARSKPEKLPSKVSNEDIDKNELLSNNIVAHLKGVLDDRGIKNTEIKEVYSLTKDNESEKISVSVTNESANGASIEKIHLALKKTPSGDTEISEIKLSKKLSEKATTGRSEKPFGVKTGYSDDVLFVVDYFISALRDLNYESAISYCLPDQSLVQKIAGLCIMIETADFKVSEEYPIEVLSTYENSSIFRINFHSLNYQKNFHFTIGLELDYEVQNPLWKISKIHLDEAFASYFSPEDSKLPFVPIRTNLNEGDCLVVYFDFKSSELSRRTQKQLLILKNFLDVFNNNSLKIYGHADEIGSQDFNMNLSIERATEVKKFLISNGIENSKINIYGKGESQEWLPNRLSSGTDNPIGRSYNRRVEIFVD